MKALKLIVLIGVVTTTELCHAGKTSIVPGNITVPHPPRAKQALPSFDILKNNLAHGTCRKRLKQQWKALKEVFPDSKELELFLVHKDLRGSFIRAYDSYSLLRIKEMDEEEQGLHKGRIDEFNRLYSLYVPISLFSSTWEHMWLYSKKFEKPGAWSLVATFIATFLNTKQYYLSKNNDAVGDCKGAWFINHLYGDKKGEEYHEEKLAACSSCLHDMCPFVLDGLD